MGDIPGTGVFDGTQARKGYALNNMCFSFNSAANRAEFLRDEAAYARKFGLNDAQQAAIAHRNVAGAARGRRQHLLPGQVRRHRRRDREGAAGRAKMPTFAIGAAD